MLKKGDSIWNTYTLVKLAVLVAMNIVLSRMLAIPVGGFGRFTLGSLCPIMAGLWFGPAGGAVVALAADLLGCLLQGYAVNPLITLGALCWGVIPGLLQPRMTGTRKRQLAVLFLAVLLSGLFGTMVFTTSGLVLINGFRPEVILPTRLVQVSVMVPVFWILSGLLYFSPLTRAAGGRMQNNDNT